MISIVTLSPFTDPAQVFGSLGMRCGIFVVNATFLNEAETQKITGLIELGLYDRIGERYFDCYIAWVTVISGRLFSEDWVPTP